MYLTVLLFTLAQVYGGQSIYGRPDKDPFEMLLGMFPYVASVMVVVVLLRVAMAMFGAQGGGTTRESSGTAATRPVTTGVPPAARASALISCGYCDSRLTSNKLSDAGRCPNCGAQVDV